MPPIQITFRKDSRAGVIREIPLATEQAYAPHNRLVLLVHGFNVSEDKAASSYRRFRYHFKTHGAPILANRLGEVYWPGDEKNKYISTALFSNKIPRAIDVSAIFERYLSSRKTAEDEPSQIVLIGHSLGCRVILEALRIMARRRRNQKQRVIVFLMAAGVPVPMVEAKGRLRQALEFTVHKYAFYSEIDEALYWFPLGQKLTGEMKLNLKKLEAVGVHGNPNDGVWTDRYRMQGFRHSDYWEKPQAADIILRKLRKPAPKSVSSRMTATVKSPPKKDTYSRPNPKHRTPTTRDLS